VRLESTEVFWSATGPQVEGSHELPDFSEQANQHFDKLAANQKVALTFLVKSDGPGTVEITVRDVEYSVIQTQSWDNPLDNTVRLDRNFELDYGTIETVALDAFDGNVKDLFLAAVRVDVSGEMGPERLLGDFEAQSGNQFVIVSPENSLAQSLVLASELTAKPIQCVGVAAAIQVDAETELYLEIQSDAADSPATGSPLTKLNLTLPPPQEGATQQWVFAQFDAPIELSPQTLYWIVFKGIRGRAMLALQEQHGGYLQRPLVNRSGQLWRELHGSAAADAALMRLVYLPDPDNQSSAIAMTLDKVSQQLDPTAQTKTVPFDLPSGRGLGPATLTIKSHARGRLSIANVIREYARQDESVLLKKALFKFASPFTKLLVQ
jgi:hypothetical protein